MLFDMHGIGAQFVYFLRSDSDLTRHYVGRTANVDQRLEWHNAGPCGYTVRHRPWSIVVSLEFPDERAAAHFEKYLKTGSGRAFAKRHFTGDTAATTTQKRPLGEDEFVSILNQLLEARFLDAPTEFPPTRVAMRKGELLYFYRHGKTSGAGWVDLTLRAGAYQKTLRIGNRDMTPVELRRVKEQIWTLGGPDAWR